ncbi:hypothetical protein LOK49_LG11G00491 [Camellia lanceoleosa]|uniref:Uncharacterized protein n=1 Tax=Camellia lanceoleosa TaxID=1840588 RepID=A0ACC0G1A8_9ERIC|nr:hypothetical protein LOK49_LG11G00491 [Camellia lanceoleosa]
MKNRSLYGNRPARSAASGDISLSLSASLLRRYSSALLRCSNRTLIRSSNREIQIHNINLLSTTHLSTKPFCRVLGLKTEKKSNYNGDKDRLKIILILQNSVMD